jgi:hypothetical protein
VIEIEGDARSTEVEAVVDMEVFACLEAASGGVCRLVACSVHKIVS